MLGSLVKAVKRVTKAAPEDSSDQSADSRRENDRHPRGMSIVPPNGQSGGSGAIAKVRAQASVLQPANTIQLQDDFCAFLAPMEGDKYRTTKKGEIVFESREAFASLVAEFTFSKMAELVAASRALYRYVEDLESELKNADSEIVG